jgi:excisionase family DNA binding protein
MEKTVFISLPIEDLQTVIIDCVNSCLKNNKQVNRESPPESDRFLNIKQAAEMLNLTVPTIYGLVHEAKIPVSKKGRRLYFSKQELMAWVKSGRRKTHEEISVEAEAILKKKRI